MISFLLLIGFENSVNDLNDNLWCSASSLLLFQIQTA